MPACTINQWHFKFSLWPQLLCILVQLAVLITFVNSPKFLMLYLIAKKWDFFNENVTFSLTHQTIANML